MKKRGYVIVDEDGDPIEIFEKKSLAILEVRYLRWARKRRFTVRNYHPDTICKWTVLEDYWISPSCGIKRVFKLIHKDPDDAKYCPHCGGRVKVLWPESSFDRNKEMIMQCNGKDGLVNFNDVKRK